MTRAIAVTDEELVVIVDALEQYETGVSTDAELAGKLWRDIVAKYWRSKFPWEPDYEQGGAQKQPSHVHKWGRWKPLPPDGDHGYQCETCDEIDWGK